MYLHTVVALKTAPLCAAFFGCVCMCLFSCVHLLLVAGDCCETRVHRRRHGWTGDLSPILLLHIYTGTCERVLNLYLLRVVRSGRVVLRSIALAVSPRSCVACLAAKQASTVPCSVATASGHNARQHTVLAGERTARLFPVHSRTESNHVHESTMDRAPGVYGTMMQLYVHTTCDLRTRCRGSSQCCVTTDLTHMCGSIGGAGRVPMPRGRGGALSAGCAQSCMQWVPGWHLLCGG